MIDLAILRADEHGRLVYANPAGRELFWRTEDGLMGAAWLDSVHLEDRHGVRMAAVQVLAEGTARVEEFRVDVMTEIRWVRGRFNAIRYGAEPPAGWIAIMEDITSDRAASDELTRRATHDPLTGLPNRVLLEDRLSVALARSRRNGAGVTVFFLDLDRFKDVNDLHGHRVGDRVLREVAARLSRAVRGADTAARLGGDEFVVVAEGLSDDVAVSVALRISSAVAAPIDVGDAQIEMKASLGIARTKHPDATPGSLIEAADAAMYDAKRHGTTLSFAPTDDDPPAG